MSENPTGCTFRYLVSSTLIIVLATVFCVSSTVAYVDYDCVKNGKAWLPIYPDAEIISEQDGYFRRYGFGTTTLVLHTPDDNNTVRKWYIAHQRKTRIERGTTGLAEIDWAVIRTPKESGTTLVLTLYCGGAR